MLVNTRLLFFGKALKGIKTLDNGSTDDPKPKLALISENLKGLMACAF